MNRIFTIVFVVYFIFRGFQEYALLTFDPREYFDFSYQSKYFHFYCEDETGTVKLSAFFCDSFVDMVNAHFFPASIEQPANFILLRDRQSFQAFLKKELKIYRPPNWGIYLKKINTLVTYTGSGYGTYAHILCYPLLDASPLTSNLPYWARTGLSTFFEKIYGYFSDGKYVLHVGFQNPWRIHQLLEKGPLTNVSLKKIVKSNPILHRSQSETRLLMVFLYKKDLLHKYLDAVLHQDKIGYGTYLEAAFSMDLSDIEPEWADYLEEIQQNKELILETPPSRLFKTREAFLRVAAPYQQ